MTFLEVLIAIALFAVFSASFLMVIEMLAALLPAANSPAQADGCDGPGLELACINVAFDQLVPELEKDLSVPGGCPLALNSLPGSAELSWPEAYECAFINTQGQAWMSKPGLQTLPRGLASIFCRHRQSQVIQLFGGFLFKGCFVGPITFA